MYDEIKTIKIINGDFNEELKIYLYDEDPDDIDLIKIEFTFQNDIYKSSSENYFTALKNLREILETKNLKLLCKGTSKNVHPSPMQLSMGTGRKAYQLSLKKQALLEDVVDIFEPSKEEEYSTVKEQFDFYNLWINSRKD